MLKKWLITLGFMVFFGAIFFAFAGFQQFLIERAEIIAIFIKNHEISGAIFFVFLNTLSVIFTFFSSFPLVPLALVAFGDIPTLIYLIIGWMLGGIISYFIGLFAGNKIAKLFLSLDKIDCYKNKISPNSQFWLVLLFRVAVPSEIAGYTLGVIRYHFGKYLIATFLSEFPFALLATYSSEALVERRFISFASTVIAGLLIVVAMSYLLKRRSRNLRKK